LEYGSFPSLGFPPTLHSVGICGYAKGH
jgi:hypothetical protein